MKFRRQVPEGHRRRGLKWAVLELVLALALFGGAAGIAGCTVETGTSTSSTSSAITSATTSSTGQSGQTGSTAGNSATTTNGANGNNGGSNGNTGSTRGNGAGNGAGNGLDLSPAQGVAKLLGPSVVNIAISGTTEGMFGQQQYYGEGSGVIYRADGMIITNNHVVSDETTGQPVNQLEVTLTTGEKLKGTIVGRDPLTDLAVIKVDAGMDLPVAKFRAAAPDVGEYAVAIGSPLGFENSVTLGVVSGLQRSIEGVAGAEGVALTNLIQTDAPISPGNSGGALADADGQVIGINVAYLPPAQTGAVNIGFAIPAVVATQVADEIINTGKATHAYMGIGTQTVTSDLQQQFNLSRASGILVAEVTSNGPAAKAGIQQGDIITDIDGQKMVESADVLVAIRDKKPGDKVQVKFDRNGKEQTLSVTLEERPANLQ